MELFTTTETVTEIRKWLTNDETLIFHTFHSIKYVLSSPKIKSSLNPQMNPDAPTICHTML